jgi:hypothetical protein
LPIYQYLSYSTLNPTNLTPSDPKKKLLSTQKKKKKKKKKKKREESPNLPYPHPPPFYPSNLKLIISSSHDILHIHIYNILDITTTQKTNIERKQEKGR